MVLNIMRFGLVITTIAALGMLAFASTKHTPEGYNQSDIDRLNKMSFEATKPHKGPKWGEDKAASAMAFLFDESKRHENTWRQP